MSIVQTYVNVKSAKIMRLVNPALMNKCLKYKKKQKGNCMARNLFKISLKVLFNYREIFKILPRKKIRASPLQ